tara:strand:+ start:198 stop:836 length:639 start_codon:yes stop_codon:yes gene_type:complete
MAGPGDDFSGGLPTPRDVRVKLQCKGLLEATFPGADIGPMKHLKHDNGIVFPYVPTIMTQYNAQYGDHRPMHSNFTYKFFQNFQLGDFTVSAPFTSHSAAEAQYTLAAFHFLKSAMKIGFGENDDYRGVPPPILNFSAWGPAIAKNVPVVVTNINTNLDANVDYVFADYENMLPLKIDLIIMLSPTYNTRETRLTYTSEDFYNGTLLRRGYN